jgi:mycofactocin precursor peptide peptidase
VSPGLAQLAWPDVGERRAGVLVLPLGATEQHGPHLPLSTDTDIAVALAEGLAGVRPGTIVAPAVAYGSSGEHERFAGTISAGPDATELLLIELVRSASAAFGRVLLLSAHGGNAEPVARAERRLRREGRDVLAWSPRWDGDAHAGRIETSIMLALRPDAVRLERAARGNAARLAELWPALREGGVAAVSPNGVLGDPAGASASEGRRLLAEAVAALDAAVDRWVAAA